MQTHRLALTPFALLILILIMANQPARAGSAIWNLNPTNSDWNTAANWVPATVPNDPADVATFDATSAAHVTLSASVQVDSVVFKPGASGYTILLTFKAKDSKAKTDKVVANGVTINTGASFNFSGMAQGTLTQGLVLTAISNTAAIPIAGTFSNLADGTILIVGANHFQANYEGGDGNDLTLTVVP